MSLIDDFKNRFPQFDEAQVDSVFPSVEASYHCYYGAVYGVSDCDDQIILQLCAHLFSVETSVSNGPSMIVQSQSAGNVSESFATGDVTAMKSFFGSTKYGQAFLMMTAKRRGPCVV